MGRAVDLLTVAGCLILIFWMLRAQLRGATHIAYRLCAALFLLPAAQMAFRFYAHPESPLTRSGLAAVAFGLVMIVVAAAQGHFHAPPR